MIARPFCNQTGTPQCPTKNSSRKRSQILTGPQTLRPPGGFFFFFSEEPKRCFGIFKSSHVFRVTSSVFLKSVDKRKPDRQNIRLIPVCCQSPEELLCCQSLQRSLILSGHRSHIRPFLRLSVCPSVCRLHMASSQAVRVLFQSSREMTNNDWREVIANSLCASFPSPLTGSVLHVLG